MKKKVERNNNILYNNKQIKNIKNKIRKTKN